MCNTLSLTLARQCRPKLEIIIEDVNHSKKLGSHQYDYHSRLHENKLILSFLHKKKPGLNCRDRENLTVIQ